METVLSDEESTDKMDEQNLLAEDEKEAEQPENNLERVQDNCQS